MDRNKNWEIYSTKPWLSNYTFQHSMLHLMLAFVVLSRLKHLKFSRKKDPQSFPNVFTSFQLQKNPSKHGMVPSIKIGKLWCQSTSFDLVKVGLAPETWVLCVDLLWIDQYSQRQDASTDAPSHMSVPPWSPRRYLPLDPLMATRPCSGNSRKKSSAFSPSEQTRPLLETNQNFPFTPVWRITKTVILLKKKKQQQTAVGEEVSLRVIWPSFSELINCFTLGGGKMCLLFHMTTRRDY